MSLENTQNDLGSVSQTVDQFIDLFSAKRKTKSKRKPMTPSPSIPSEVTPMTTMTPTTSTMPSIIPPTIVPTEPGQPTVVTSMPTTQSDRLIEALTPLKIQFVSPLEIKNTMGATPVSDSTTPTRLIADQKSFDPSKPVTIYTIDKTPSDPTMKSQKEKELELWEKWQWIGLVVSIIIPITTVILAWILNRNKKRSGSRKRRRR